MVELTLEEKEKQEKLKKLIKTISDLSIKKKELQRNKRNKKILIRAIKGTFMAAFLWAKVGDFMSPGDAEISELDSSNSEPLLDEALLDDTFLDEAFEDLFEAFEEIEISDVDALVGEMDLCSLSIAELDAAQNELNLLIIKIS